MKKHTIIVIGREFGSGGHEIGNRLSERLGIPLYDRNLIQMAAKELDITHEEVEKVDESLLERFLSAQVVGMNDYTAFVKSEVVEEVLSDKIFRVQTQMIKKLAKRESCIFVGRCADYILEDHFECINVFIYANEQDKIDRIKRIYNMSEAQAKDKMEEKDYARKLYYEARTNRAWGDIKTHQALFNVSKIDPLEVVDILAAMYRSRR